MNQPVYYAVSYCELARHYTLSLWDIQVSLSKQVESRAVHISHVSGVVVAKCVGYLSLNWWCNCSQMHYQYYC